MIPPALVTVWVQSFRGRPGISRRERRQSISRTLESFVRHAV